MPEDSPIMFKVTPHQVASSEGRHEREFTSDDRGADDTGETTRILSGILFVRSPYPQHLKHKQQCNYYVARDL